MKVLALGGGGTYGRRVAAILAATETVSEIVIGGRNLEATEAAAAELGDKAAAVRVDALDEEMVATLAADADLVVNTAGPDHVVGLPGLRAALKAGVDYCDLDCDGPTVEAALELDQAAKAAGVTALVGIGMMPGLSGLMMKHTASRLGRADELLYCFTFPVVYAGDPETVLAEWRKAGHADASWQTMMRQVTGKVRVYRDGRLLEVTPFEAGVPVTLSQGTEVTAYPIAQPDVFTLPSILPDVRSVSVLACYFPVELNHLSCKLGQGIARGEVANRQPRSRSTSTSRLSPRVGSATKRTTRRGTRKSRRRLGSRVAVASVSDAGPSALGHRRRGRWLWPR